MNGHQLICKSHSRKILQWQRSRDELKVCYILVLETFYFKNYGIYLKKTLFKLTQEGKFKTDVLVFIFFKEGPNKLYIVPLTYNIAWKFYPVC